MSLPSIAFIGFGEAGQALAEGFKGEGVASLSAWDIAFSTARTLADEAQRIGVRRAASSADAVRGADLVFSAVTAASNLEAAEQAAPGLSADQYFIDLNSVSPGRKRKAAQIVGGRARFVGMAVMSPIHPLRHKSPVLVSGAVEAVALLQSIGMDVQAVGDDAGAATAIKMVRSVMIKGLEALTQECFLAARKAGVEDRIIATLSHTFPTLDWAKLVDYNMERMAEHGIRRAAEMREVCETLEELGVDPALTRGTVERQQRTGDAGLKDKLGGSVPRDRALILDALVRARGPARA